MHALQADITTLEAIANAANTSFSFDSGMEVTFCCFSAADLAVYQHLLTQHSA